MANEFAWRESDFYFFKVTNFLAIEKSKAIFRSLGGKDNIWL